MPDYAFGSTSPDITPDEGSGSWCSAPMTAERIANKQLLKGALYSGQLDKKFGPEAVHNLKHYLDKTGNTVVHDGMALLRRSVQLQMVFSAELQAAKQFCQIQAACTNAPICSTKAGWGAFTQEGDPHLFYAIGGFKYWGQGSVSITPVDAVARQIKLDFEFHLFDRYNWDSGKKIRVPSNEWIEKARGWYRNRNRAPDDPYKDGAITISDTSLQKFHRQCLAKEFDQRAIIRTSIEWRYRLGPEDMLNQATNTDGTPAKPKPYNPFDSLNAPSPGGPAPAPYDPFKVLKN
jgi:hypothetical protein